MAEIGTDIEKAKHYLTNGELVAIPTETVYGLAGNALSPSSVAKIFETKNRPEFDPLIIHVPDFDSVNRYAKHIPPIAEKLAIQFWPGPLTLVLERTEVIPDLVTSGLDTVGIRCPNHPLTKKLLEELPFPLAAPSANPFGYISPTQPEHVNEQLGKRIAYILDGGVCPVGIESTIIGFNSNKPIIYRMGGLSVEEIEGAVGSVEIQTHSSSNPRSPGQLKSHYAPKKRMIIGEIEKLLGQNSDNNRVGILSFEKNYNSKNQFILSATGDINKAAQNLFLALRTLDKMDIEVIFAELVPNVGLGRAINDRLKRASSTE